MGLFVEIEVDGYYVLSDCHCVKEGDIMGSTQAMVVDFCLNVIYWRVEDFYR